MVFSRQIAFSGILSGARIIAFMGLTWTYKPLSTKLISGIKMPYVYQSPLHKWKRASKWQT
jgi:hypothetical protein